VRVLYAPEFFDVWTLELVSLMTFCNACNGHGYIVIEQRIEGKLTTMSQGCRECLTTGRVTELEQAAQIAANEERKRRAAEVVRNWRARN
jgi:DnaJ-class molecular chaperone